ncbi:U7 snRNA-associated Sm-like protein LSm11 [Anomaloglossus baeobatrachus]|uniref:U7 snRNA-associated Sm-like protein LSm11 n=1 Tax=Anomaloglossus baeobatrachus TaxID=238106 RepID=UPI003F4FB60B
MASEEDAVPACSLDVTSESFDPLLALYSSATPLPFPDVHCFNNLAEYESFLQRGGRPRGRSQKREKKGRRPAPDPERVQRLKNLMLPVEPGSEQSRAPRRGPRAPRNVLTRMALLGGSPAGRLYRCVQERLRVHVHTRTFRGLRGVCSGFIVAFDKFWNLAMVDVDETYRRPVLGRAFYSEPQLTLPRLLSRLRLQEAAEEAGGKTAGEEAGGKTAGEEAGGEPRSSGRRKKPDYQRVHSRHIRQLFIRGESVLLVHVPE